MLPAIATLLVLQLGLQAGAGHNGDDGTWRETALQSVADGEPFLTAARHVVRPVRPVQGDGTQMTSTTVYRVGQDTFLELGIPESRHMAVLGSLASLQLVDVSSLPADTGQQPDEPLRLPAFVRADGVAWLLSGGALAVDEFEAALRLSSSRLPVAVADRVALLTESAVSAAVDRLQQIQITDSPTRLVVVGKGYVRSLCVDRAGVFGWLGTILGLLMTQMPTKRR